MQNTKCIEVKNLTLFHHNKILLENISFTVEQGKTLGIMGKSGSGKSLTALSLIGLLPKTITVDKKSSCIYNNVDILQLDEKVKTQFRGKEIAYIFQDSNVSLNPLMRCGKQILESVMLHHEKDKHKAIQIVKSYLLKVELNDVERFYNAYPHELSGGQKQRIIIAIALACKPKVLIADEPTTSLDNNTSNEIITLIKNIQVELNLTLIFISHEYDLIHKISDKILILDKGKIIQLYSNNIGLKNELNKSETHSIKNDFSNNENIIKIENLSYFYTNSNAIFNNNFTPNFIFKNYNIEIKKNIITGLIGKSGIGKSTLANILVGLNTNYTGEIFVGNETLKLFYAKKENRKKVQIIYQDPYGSLQPQMPIGKAIQDVMRNFGLFKNDAERKKKTIELLQKVQLNVTDYEKYPHQFSGGQRQRIAIARALAAQPELLICDECISSLDLNTQNEILEMLKQAKNKYNLSIIFISHNLDVVQNFCDTIIHL